MFLLATSKQRRVVSHTIDDRRRLWIFFDEVLTEECKLKCEYGRAEIEITYFAAIICCSFVHKTNQSGTDGPKASRDKSLRRNRIGLAHTDKCFLPFSLLCVLTVQAKQIDEMSFSKENHPAYNTAFECCIAVCCTFSKGEGGLVSEEGFRVRIDW